MSRFYQSGKPDFVENFMYTPPWELAQQAMAYNDKGISDTIQAASLFNNIDINYIPDPVEKANVERELKRYSDKANEYSTNMQLQLQNSPQSWKKYLPQLQTLGTDLSKNLKTGNLAKIQQSAAALAAWKEANKDVLEKDPNFYYSGLNYYLSKWQENPNRSADAVFTGDNLSKFDINGKDIMAGFDKFETEMKTVIGKDGYIYENEGVTRDRVISAYMNKVFSDPQAQAYMKQAIAFKLPGFVDEKGQAIRPLVPMNIKTGQQLSQEDYDKEISRISTLTDEQKAIQGVSEKDYQIAPNKKFAWTGAFEGLADVKAGMKQKISADNVYLTKMKIASAERMANQKIAADFKLKAMEIDAAARADEKKKGQEIETKKSQLEHDIVLAGGPETEMGKKLQKELDNLNSATKASTRAYNSSFQLSDFQGTLSKNDTESSVTDLVRNINRTLVGKALKATGLGELSEARLTDTGKDFYKVKTYSKEGDELTKFVLAVDKSKSFNNLDEIVDGYLINKKGYKKEDLYKNTTAKPGASIYELRTSSSNIFERSPLFQKYRNTLEKYVKAKKDALSDYNHMSDNMEINPVTSYGEQKLKKEYSENSRAFQVVSTNLESNKTPNLYDLATLGKIVGTTTQSAFGPATIIRYGDTDKAQDYIVFSNSSKEANANKNAEIYNDKDMYATDDQYTKMYSAIEYRMRDALINTASELHRSQFFYNDDKNRGKDGKPLKYSSTSLPIGQGNAVTVRYYPDDIKGGNYTIVANDGSTVYKNQNFMEIGKTVETIIQNVSKTNDEIIKSNITY